MALNITQELETKNINKQAELKSANGELVGTVSFNVTNQQYNGISLNVNITSKELFVAEKETYKKDIQSFLDTFITETLEVMGVETAGGKE